ncbi:MAG: hypothetical protein V7647_4218, partial [Acidobacteriota bacterium]
MNKTSNGIDIVASLAADRPYWRLDASQVDTWVKSLHRSATAELVSRTEWIGDAWDGISDIEVAGRHVGSAHLVELLNELRTALTARGCDGVTAPDVGCVRHCFVGPSARESLAIDFDFGDFVVPLCLDAGVWTKIGDASPSQIADRMVSLLGNVDNLRDRILVRELRMRRAFEEAADGIGEGAAPLWFRLQPLPLDQEAQDILYSPYLMIFVVLDECLEWSPVGTENACTVKDVRDYRGYLKPAQRRRAHARADLEARGSRGSISPIALALIEERNLDPVAIFDEAREARLADRRAAVEFNRAERKETLFYNEGILGAAFPFEGGHFYFDSLMLWGEFPETLVNSAKHRALASFVDHP